MPPIHFFITATLNLESLLIMQSHKTTIECRLLQLRVKVTKLDKINKATSKSDDFGIFPIYGQLGAIRIPEAKSIKLTFS